MSDSAVLPAVRRGVVWRVVGGEAVVYNPAGDVVEALTERGALVLAACDGQTLEAQFASQHCWHRSEVLEVLVELADLGLLDPAAVTAVDSETGSTRRAMLQRSAMVGGGIVIATVAAPMASAAATGDLGSNHPGAGGVYPVYAGNYNSHYYYPVGTQVSGLTPGDVITGFQLSQTQNSSPGGYYGSDVVTFAVIDGSAGLPTNAPDTTGGVNAVTEAAPFGGSSSTATASGLMHLVPDSGQVIIAAYLPNSPSSRYFDYVSTGQSSDLLYTDGRSASDYSLVFTVFGYTPTAMSGAAGHRDHAEIARSRSRPAARVLAHQAPFGLAIPPGMPRPGEFSPGKPGPAGRRAVPRARRAHRLG